MSKFVLVLIVYLAIIERRCCWWNCGPSNSVGIYEGVETYFCTGDGCNGYGVESALSPAGKGEQIKGVISSIFEY